MFGGNLNFTLVLRQAGPLHIDACILSHATVRTLTRAG
jgi:hypothetical protein